MATTTSSIDAPVLSTTPRRWYKQLWIQVLIAMALGIAGRPLLSERRHQPATARRRLHQADPHADRPIIFCTVVLGIAKMDDMSRVGRVAIKGLIYFEVMTTLALIVAWWWSTYGSRAPA
jgi:aerobic C4-dicarboxylate transport protein